MSAPESPKASRRCVCGIDRANVACSKCEYTGSDWVDALFSVHSVEEIAAGLERLGVRMSAFDSNESKP